MNLAALGLKSHPHYKLATVKRRGIYENHKNIFPNVGKMMHGNIIFKYPSLKFLKENKLQFFFLIEQPVIVHGLDCSAR